MPSQLKSEDRMRLMRFVCSFAWADLKVRESERAYVHRIVRELGLDPKERAQVEEWLRVPPPPEDLDPTSIPRKHRETFLAAAKAIVASDGAVGPEEAENLTLFKALMR